MTEQVEPYGIPQHCSVLQRRDQSASRFNIDPGCPRRFRAKFVKTGSESAQIGDQCDYKI
ncbi:MAG TPA: hypothetical protein VIR04_00835, partial [Paralcaligenes sp.]